MTTFVFTSEQQELRRWHRLHRELAAGYLIDAGLPVTA